MAKPKRSGAGVPYPPDVAKLLAQRRGLMGKHSRNTRTKFNLLERHTTLLTLIGQHSGGGIPDEELAKIGAKGRNPITLQGAWGERLRGHDFRLGRLTTQIRGIEEQLRAGKVEFEPWRPPTFNDIRRRRSQGKPRSG